MREATARQMPAPPEETRPHDGKATAGRAARVRSLTGAGAYLIPLFGLYGYRKEADPYQRRRILWVVGLYLPLWVLIPGLLGYREVVPQIDGRARVFPAIHYVESLGFFLYFVPTFFFGRRADCGWCCPCAASRETFSAAFRDRAPKGEGW